MNEMLYQANPVTVAYCVSDLALLKFISKSGSSKKQS